MSQRKFYLLSFALCLAASPALAAPLQNWRYNPATNQLEITVRPGVKPRYTFAAYPARIILELPNTEVGNVKLQESYSGAVRQIQVAQSQSTARITLVLAPDVVLSKEQAQLQQVREQDRSSDRWVFRPLLANTANTTAVPRLSAVTPAPRAGTAPSTPPPVVYPPGLSPSETSSGATGNPGVLAPPASAMDLPPSEAPPTAIPTPPTADQFPPGLAPSGQPSITVPKAQPDLPQTPPREVVSQAPQNSSEVVSQAPPANPLRLPEVNPSLAIPDSLPPVSVPTTPTAPTVSVPPLQRTTPTTGAGLPPTMTESFPPLTAQPPQPAQSVLGAPLQPQTPQVLPQALPQALPQPVPLPPDQTSQFSQSLPPSIPQTTTVATAGTIEFGQPLPIGGRSSSSNYASLPSQPPLVSVASPTEGVILPSGTLLNLSYPGSQVLKLEANKPRQEVVLLQTEIRDRAGNLIIPFGSQVYGRFETNRFIAQSIAINGRSFPFVAQSDALGGVRQVNDRRLLLNSGIGAVAGALLGGLSGGTVAGGAAVGAGVTYATAPKPATIAPGQIFQVRLTQDLR
ncbi:MAG: AMIN domain-containing protein [Myxacorys chilensis ATA2-1-KO14]|nr:AMIN domain-containing protein [Myxacorys chilensis ATA2-1-KO14]